jgi:hypothetical protein
MNLKMHTLTNSYRQYIAIFQKTTKTLTGTKKWETKKHWNVVLGLGRINQLKGTKKWVRWSTGNTITIFVLNTKACIEVITGPTI